MKRLLAIALLFSSIIPLLAQQTFTVDNVNYRVTSIPNNEVEVIQSNNPPVELVIPSTVSNDGITYTVTAINNFALAGEDLISVVIPNTVTSIGLEAFSNNNLTNLELPNSVTDISLRAFDSNTLTNITLGNNIINIAPEAFQNNPNLMSVTSNTITPPTLEENVFFNTSIDKTLTVPEGAEAAYIAAGWTDFTSINGLFLTGNTFIVNEITYEVTSNFPNEVKIIDNTNNGALQIQATVSINAFDYSVVSIDTDAFRGDGLTSIDLPNSIISIRNSAFRDNSLTSVTIPSSVTGIGGGAFRNNNLTSIIIPENVNTVGASAFRENIALATVISENPEAPTRGENYFADTADGKKLIIPLGAEASYEAKNWTGFIAVNGEGVIDEDFILDGVTYNITANSPNAVTAIQNTNTGAIAIPAITTKNDISFDVVAIGTDAFRGNSVTDVTIPVGVTSIGSAAFRNNLLTSVILPESVNDIGDAAFRDNPNLALVTSNNTQAPQINTTVFASTASEKTLVVPPSTEAAYLVAGWTGFTITDELVVGSTFTQDGIAYEVTSVAPDKVEIIDNTNMGTLTIPTTVSENNTEFNVTSIGNEAFANNQLTSVIIPNSIETIKSSAFQDNLLTDVNIGNGVLRINEGAFLSNQLTSIILPESIMALEDFAFAENPNLALVISNNSMPPSISGVSFANTAAIKTLTVPDGTEADYIAAGWIDFFNVNQEVVLGNTFIVDGITYEVTSNTPNTVEAINNTNTGSVTIPALVTANSFDFSVSSIGVGAFAENQLTSVTIPNSVISIGNAAFEANQLTSVIIPSGVISIGSNAFESNQLTSVAIPNSVISIGNQSFDDNQLSSITLPEGLVSIPQGAFRDNQLTSVEIGNSVTSLGVDAFRSNQLTDVTIPNSVTSIGTRAFQDNQLETIDLGEGLQTLDGRAFFNNNLTTIAIPNTVISIGDNTFSNNPDLVSVTSNNTTPPTLEGVNVFSNTSVNRILAVPVGTETAYANAGWTGFLTVNGEAVINETFAIEGITYIIISSSPNKVDVIANANTGAVQIPPTVTNLDFSMNAIREEAFRNTGLTSVVIPEGVIDIGLSAFRDNNLTSVTLPSSLLNIDAGAFRNNELTSIVIPENVTNVGAAAFSDNIELTSVTSKNLVAPTRGNNFFANTASEKTLFIPVGSTQSYSDKNWTGFTTIEEITFDIVVAPKVFLQGAALNPITGEEDLMRDSLRENGLLPTIAPDGDGAFVAPMVWNTTGANAIVDWVLVELREGPDNENTTVVTSKVALLQRDGDIVGLDGTSNITLTVDEGDYFIAIKHRNHIGILTVVPAPLSSAATALDFTQDATIVKGENLALTTLVNGTFAMIAGDADGSSQILNTDITEALTLAGGGEAYSTADADMNGFVLNSDIQLLVLANSGTVQQFD